MLRCITKTNWVISVLSIQTQQQTPVSFRNHRLNSGFVNYKPILPILQICLFLTLSTFLFSIKAYLEPRKTSKDEKAKSEMLDSAWCPRKDHIRH